MDVRCERCKTEYEFDDARITEAGVAVKCTTCAHVFKVKKKALVVTVPVKPGELEQAGAAPIAAQPPAQAPVPAAASEKHREWKVRQANGNVFSFKELTTLQKWIVERKVSRDDEISLTGETWKRLGNIAELASFFQVVDEAQKAAQLQALQSQGLLSPAPVAPPQPAERRPSVQLPVGPSAADPVFAQKRMAARSAERTVPLRDEEDVAAAGIKKSGGGGKWLAALLVLAALGGGGYYGYPYLVPALAPIRPPEPVVVAAKPDAGAAVADAGSGATAEAAGPIDAGALEAVAAPAVAEDAGTTVTADVQPEPAASKRSPTLDFDGYMSQGDRLRMREKYEAALDAYGKAAELKPTRAEPVAGKGLALLDMGQQAPAEASFREALRLNPRYAVAVMGLAETYRQMGRKSEAIEYYQRYLDILPNGPEAPVAKAALARLKE